MKLDFIKKSTRKDKKYMAKFSDPDKIVHFGAKGYSDYTLHKDKDRRENYRARHASGKTAAPDTANALAYHLLWGDSTSLSENIKSYRLKYSL